MIDKIKKEEIFTFDFMWSSTDRVIVNKINEIIDYINKKESEDKQWVK